MTKTKEEKRLYCKEWRIKNRDKYLAQRKKDYFKNKNNWRDKAKERAKKYYYEVKLLKRKAEPELYKTLDKEHNQKRLLVRRNHIRELRERMGGKCTQCGYNEIIDILQFHHQGKKEDNVSKLQTIKKREREAKKCILLCPNCHAIETLKNI